MSKQKFPPWLICQKGGTLYSGARYVALWASCLCIHLGEGRGGALMHVYACIYMGTHSQPFLQNRLMDINETWQGRSAHGPLQVLLFFCQIRAGADPGRGKNRSEGVPFFNNFFSDRKATATNRMHSNDLDACAMKYCYFWFYSEVWTYSHFGLF